MQPIAALAESPVKVAARDMVATWKILVALGLTPVSYAFYAFLAAVLAIRAGASTPWVVWTSIATFFTLPCIAYAALKFGEAGMDVLKSLQPLFTTLIPGQSRVLDEVKAMRIEVSNELADVVRESGPKLWDDFDMDRIPVPSASAPPSSGTPGLWRRKSSTGGVDAQGSFLVHPMTWLDERLFGWSRSASRGTSAWAGTPSTEISRASSPAPSEGDYDNVLGYLEARKPAGRSRSRSHQNSYADLQKLREDDGRARALASSDEQAVDSDDGVQIRRRGGFLQPSDTTGTLS